MEIINKFGLDPFLFGAQVINFIIVFYLLKRFLYKPILFTLKKREQTIKEGLKQGEEGRMILDKALEKEKQILQKAQGAAKKTMEDAKNQATLISQEMQENSKKQSEKILAQAREQIAQETKEAEKRLMSRISSVSLELLEKALSSMFSEKTQKELMENAIKKLRTND